MEKTKKTIRNVLYGAAWLLCIVPPFIAGVCCKEETDSGFEKAIGWITMAVVVVLSAVVLYLKHKGKLFNREDKEEG